MSSSVGFLPDLKGRGIRLVPPVKPWNPVIVEHDQVEAVAGVLETSFVPTAVERLAAVCGA